MEDGEALVILALNVELVQSAFIQDILKENHIECVVTGDYASYGSRGFMYGSPTGMGRYTIKVKRMDEDAAIKLMQEYGYQVVNEDMEEQNFLSRLASPTERIPFLAKYSLNARLAIMGIAVTTILIIIISLYAIVFY